MREAAWGDDDVVGNVRGEVLSDDVGDHCEVASTNQWTVDEEDGERKRWNRLNLRRSTRKWNIKW